MRKRKNIPEKILLALSLVSLLLASAEPDFSLFSQRKLKEGGPVRIDSVSPDAGKIMEIHGSIATSAPQRIGE